MAAMIGGAPLPDFANECDYVGALAGTQLEVVKCETNDCLVPANAEIVFEGSISIVDVADEGPFGEVHGYLWKGESKKYPLFTVDAITYRNGAIMPICATGRATDETHTILGISAAADILFTLRQAGIPVINVCSPILILLYTRILIFELGPPTPRNKHRMGRHSNRHHRAEITLHNTRGIPSQSGKHVVHKWTPSPLCSQRHSG
jgi:UbiD family decarboxylase